MYTRPLCPLYNTSARYTHFTTTVCKCADNFKSTMSADWGLTKRWYQVSKPACRESMNTKDCIHPSRLAKEVNNSSVRLQALLLPGLSTLQCSLKVHHETETVHLTARAPQVPWVSFSIKSNQALLSSVPSPCP